MQMKKILILMLLIISISFYSCKKSSQFTEEKLVEIYASVELDPIEKSIETVKKFGLDDETKRDNYYNALRDLSTDRDKWEKFLTRVDQYKNTPR